MECAIFAIVGVVVGAVLTLFAKGDLAAVVKPRAVRKRAEKVGETELPGKAKTEEQLMRQWESLLCYSGSGNDDVRI